MSVENSSVKIVHSRSTRIPLVIVERQHDAGAQHRFREEMLPSSKHVQISPAENKHELICGPSRLPNRKKIGKCHGILPEVWYSF